MNETAHDKRRSFTNQLSLHAQVAILLAIAVTPIGAVGISQTLFTAREASRLAETALVNRTRWAADDQRAAVTAAFGAAQGLAITLPLDQQGSATCSVLLRELVESDPRFLYGAVIDPDGSIQCSSRPGSQRPSFFDDLEKWNLAGASRNSVRLSSRDPIIDAVVLNVLRSVDRGGEHVGTLLLSMPVSLFRTLARAADDGTGFRLALLDGLGQVFAESSLKIGEPDWAPVRIDLEGSKAVDEQVFTDISRSQERRSYAVVPIVGGEIYAIGSWRYGDLEHTANRRTALAILFPVSMWVLALGVSYFAVYRLAVRHITYLRRVMHAFEGGRRSVRAGGLQDSAPELVALGQTFDRMADTIEQDERELERAIEEKNILLREIYHRVKNNLQLVISMMNLQMRQSHSDDERTAIARLQDRVMGLAAVHQQLYQTGDLTAVRCNGLLTEITTNLCESTQSAGKVTVEHNFIPLVLDPDRAIPLSLFATETIMNALKHGEGAENGMIRVSLKDADDGNVRLEVINTIATDSVEKAPDGGLGYKLIEAFSRQLEGSVEISELAGEHRISLTFKP
jgi:two-component sensor histidine kinase